MIKKLIIVIICVLIYKPTNAKENIMILKLKDGDVVIELFKEVAPNHVERFKKLSKEKKYDGVVFHRVIDGFMAQTGDVKYGNSKNESYQNIYPFSIPQPTHWEKVGRHRSCL